MKTISAKRLTAQIRATVFALSVTLAVCAQLPAAPPQAAGGGVAAYPVKVSSNGRYLVDQ